MNRLTFCRLIKILLKAKPVLLLFLITHGYSAHAELPTNQSFKFWQLIDPEKESFDQILKTPEIEWLEMHNGYSSVPLLSDEYWNATKGEVFWVKVQIPRRLSSQRIWIELSPNVGLEGQLAIYTKGHWNWTLPAGKQNSNHPDLPVSFLTFLLEKPKSHHFVYLKLQTSQVFNFKIRAISDETFISSAVMSHIFNGFIFGFLLLAIVYNLSIGVSAGERLYLYYAFYVFSTLLYLLVLSGYPRLFFPEWGGSGSLSNLTVLLAIFGANVFIRELLNTRETIPKVDLLLRYQQIALFACIFLIGFVSDLVAYCFAEVLGIGAPAIVFIAGIASLKQGNPIARYFLVAWLFFIICGFMWAFMWLGLTEPSITNLRLLLLGSAIEVMLLSLLLGYRFSDLKNQTTNLTNAKLEYQNLSQIDSLTGLYNRHGLIDKIDEMIKSSTIDLILLEINIDNFKQFNKLHGHLISDQLLSEFGNLLKTKVRRENLAAELVDKENNTSYRRGLVGRLGGGEFTILLSNCSIAQSRLYGERLKRDFEGISISEKSGTDISATISIGILTVQPKRSIDQVLIDAKNVINLAKEQGTSQIVIQSSNSKS